MNVKNKTSLYNPYSLKKLNYTSINNYIAGWRGVIYDLTFLIPQTNLTIFLPKVM